MTAHRFCPGHRRLRLGATGLALIALLPLAGCSEFAPVRALRVGAGFASHHVCSDVFLSGMTPEVARDERIRPQFGMRWVDRFMTVRTDMARREVVAEVAGLATGRARFVPGGGCTRVNDDTTVAASAPVPSADAPAADEPPLVPPASPALAAALALAFDEGDDGPHAHQTKAVVVLHDGRLVAERYAPGTGPQTPWLGFSMSKSLTNALVGIAVRQGRLALDRPAGFAGWSADARAGITLAHLLRQDAGLDFRQDNSGFDDNARMLYLEPDMAAFAARAGAAHPPGTHWAYTDANFVLASRLLRSAVADGPSGAAADPARALRDFARRELFEPLGMRHMTLEGDASGTLQGASFFFGAARDWARLGQLFLDDGVAGGRRLLPEGWVRWSTTPTLDTAYGAGWWTNALGGAIKADWGVPWGFSNAPRDTFFARGFMGQYTVVIPSERLVIVRLGISHRRGDDIAFVDRLVGAVRAAVAGSPPAVTAPAPGSAGRADRAPA